MLIQVTDVRTNQKIIVNLSNVVCISPNTDNNGTIITMNDYYTITTVENYGQFKQFIKANLTKED